MKISFFPGGFVAKTLLILMLMTTKLLAGSGGSLYLCVSDDGSHCCIDTGPASCACCHDHEQISHDTCCSDHPCEDDSAATSCEQNEDEAAPLGQRDLLADEPCECTHIPVMISTNQPTTVARSLMMAEAEWLSLQISVLSVSCGSVEDPASSQYRCWSGPPTVPDFTLTVISTVVLRC